MKKVEQVNQRFLSERERSICGNEIESPLVIEAKAVKNLPDYFSENSAKIMGLIYKHGAVLLRGFSVKSETEFEQSIRSLKGFKPMNDYFLAEHGRDLLPGCEYVYYTNRSYKTGGTFYFGGFHTENHYTCDVPHFISFWCRKPSVLGGETGLINLTKVYEDLRPSIKEKLGKTTFLVASLTIGDLSQRYNISEKHMIELCTEFGLELGINDNGQNIINIYKPSVIVHPITEKSSLVGNLSAEIVGLDKALNNEFQNAYLGLKWKIHRLVWKRYPTIALISQTKAKNLRFWIPWLLKEKVIKRNKKQPDSNPGPVPNNRLGSAFSLDDVNDLSKSVRKHFTAFKWEKGDILLIDNLQTAHAGMPGFGNRIIRAVLGNPVPLKFSSSSIGRQSIRDIDEHISMAAKLVEVQIKK